ALDSAGVACKTGLVKDGSPLVVGSHWYRPEAYGGENFRWADNGAQIKLTAAQPTPFVLEAFVEPGPGLGGVPLQLSVKDERGAVIAKGQAQRIRGYAVFALPPAPVGATLTLLTPSKNAKSPGDPRTLNFRVFDLKIKPHT
ncbi:MAG: hypothetical protein M3N19_05420, partial [Candidatus Eremiobacteraeota bacterium]|nr:hypothetical protein [Candidatus Eremiobacteraeota bacterium]